MLSIIIPVFNGDSHISSCIKSINVSMENKDYLEVIVINDGSTDSTLEILYQNFGSLDYLKIISYPENKGVSHARNIGLDNASRPYVMFLDSDDTMEDGATDFIVYNLKKIPQHVKAIKFSKTNKTGNYRKSRLMSMLSTSDELNALHGHVYRTNLAKKIKFDKNVTMAEDFLFNFEYIYNFSTDDLGQVIDINIYNYNCTTGSITQKKDLEDVERKLNDVHYVYHKIFRNKKNGLSTTDYKELFYTKYAYELVRQYSVAFRNTKITRHELISLYDFVHDMLDLEDFKRYKQGIDIDYWIFYKISLLLFNNKKMNIYYNLFVFRFIRSR